jgi:RNA polymerase sigma factor (sigma-70 family)
LQSGDQAAFRYLVDTYQQKVLNTAVSMVQDEALAEDVAQEVFVTVFKSILSFREGASISTWIYRITINKCLDHLRAQKRRPGFFSFLQPEEHNARNFIHPGVVAEQRENSRRLFNAIDKLADNQRTAFVLTYIEELPQAQVGEIMGLSVKAVESLLQRAKHNLRKSLSGMLH